MRNGTLTIRADWQLKQVKLLMHQLQEKRLKRVLASIVNKSAKQVETAAETIVAEETSIPKKRTQKGIYIYRKASPNFLETEITGSAVPVPLGMMGAKESKTGVRLKMWGKKVHMPHAFLKGGKFPDRKKIRGRAPHVFERVENSSRQFKALPGIAVAESMGSQENMKKLIVIAHERVEANLKRMLQRAIFQQNNGRRK